MRIFPLFKSPTSGQELSFCACEKHLVAEPFSSPTTFKFQSTVFHITSMQSLCKYLLSHCLVIIMFSCYWQPCLVVAPPPPSFTPWTNNHALPFCCCCCGGVVDSGFVLSCCFPTGVPRTTDHALPNANPLLRVRSSSTHTIQPTNLTKPTNQQI